MDKRYRFGFLFLDAIHHINHFVTIAVALSESNEVTILTYPSEHTYLKEKLLFLKGHKVIIKELHTHPFRRLTDTLKNRALPRKGFWMEFNKECLIKDYDALFFTDYIHHKLMHYRGIREFPKFIKLPHGPAGRSYGYKKDLRDFDLHLIFGKHYYKELKKNGLLGNKTKVAGYFKNDALRDQKLPSLFANAKPIVVYNPHFDKKLSSWHIMGIAVLEYFKNQSRFNLIFAPHINLFNKSDIKSDVKSDITIRDTYKDIPHIHVDTGSVASVDMVYTKMADIYLGDVSSQAIEFVINPRPCIFINAHGVHYEGNHNYHFWKNGDVVQTIKELDEALQDVQDNFSRYEQRQGKTLKKNFKICSKSTPTDRAVKKILKFMNKSQL